MNNKRIKTILIVSLVLVEFLTVFLSVKSFNNKPIENTKEEINTKRKQFSMYVENDNGEYEEYNSSNLFPEGYSLNLEKSTCVDNAGKEVSGVLSSNGNKVTITSNKTVFCYVYFDKLSLADYLIKNVSSEELWDSPLEGDGYRYVGTAPNNYICFGTTDKDFCTNNTDYYMYRIIGIFEDNNGNQHLKLIKKEALNTKYAWHSNYQTSTEWDETDLYKGINGSYFDYYYMQNNQWANKIATWNYTMTNSLTWEYYSYYNVYGPDYNYVTGKTLYLHELNRIGKSSSCSSEVSNTDCSAGTWISTTAKVGLMYVSDYVLSLGSSSLDYVGTDNYRTMKTSWMHISNNDSEAPSSTEWTMSRYGHTDNAYYMAWRIYSDGYIDFVRLDNTFSVRPVFYLESNIELSGGTGTITDPYIIK